MSIFTRLIQGCVIAGFLATAQGCIIAPDHDDHDHDHDHDHHCEDRDPHCDH